MHDYITPSHDEINPVKPWGRTCWKGSKSSTSNATETNNVDKRQVVDNGVGVSSDSSTVTVNVLDEGIVKAALDSVNNSINATSAADATNGEGFSRLLGLADKLFTGAGELVGKTQDTALAQIDRVNSAANDKAGSIDQKTVVVLGIAAAAALVLSKKL